MVPPLQAGLVITATAGNISNPSPNVSGGGDITTIFNQAVAYWEMAFPDPGQNWTLDLTYNWAPPAGGQVAQFTAGSVSGGNPNRILSGSINFSNVDSEFINWFADPNPGTLFNNPAFTIGPTVTNETVTATSGNVNLNTGITFQSELGSPAYDRSDLLTIAMHEIGHGLGLLYNQSPPNPPPAFEPNFPLIVTEEVSPYYEGFDIFVEAPEHLTNPSLMESMTPSGFRVLPSSRDILTMATISQYDAPLLNPYNIPGVPVPEPSSGLLGLVGIALLLLRRRGIRAGV